MSHVESARLKAVLSYRIAWGPTISSWILCYFNLTLLYGKRRLCLHCLLLCHALQLLRGESNDLECAVSESYVRGNVIKVAGWSWLWGDHVRHYRNRARLRCNRIWLGHRLVLWLDHTR